MPGFGNFNPNDHEPTTAFEPLPAGWYAMEITDSEARVSVAGNEYIQLELMICEQYHPEHKGRRVWANLNLWNSNPKAVEIAQRELSAICKAVGETGIVSESEALHNRPMAVKLKFVPAKDGHNEKNETSGFDTLAARIKTAQAPAAPQPGSAAPSGQAASETPF